MYEVVCKEKKELYSARSLDEAMVFAKGYAEFVTIKGPDFELVGIFGADAVEDGKCPDGSNYTWKKRRI